MRLYQSGVAASGVAILITWILPILTAAAVSFHRRDA